VSRGFVLPMVLLVCVVLAGCTGVGPTPGLSPPSTPTPTASPSPRTAAVVDGGARPMAEGKAAPQPDGSVQYTVAEGDVSGVVCERFGLTRTELRGIDASKSGYRCGVMIFVDEVLLLSH